MAKERRITWSPSALQDLKDAFEFISADRPKAAHEFLGRIVNQIGKLARFPQLGRTIPEVGKSRYRELIVGEYRIFHEVSEKEVLIFRIIHSRQSFRH